MIGAILSDYNMEAVKYELEMMRRNQMKYIYAYEAAKPETNVRREPIRLPMKDTVTYIYGRGSYGLARSENEKSFKQDV